jgi:hypothetical protein
MQGRIRSFGTKDLLNMKYQKKQTKEQKQMKQQMIEGGLAARWAEYDGLPILLVRNKESKYPYRSKKWWVVTAPMYFAMRQNMGVLIAFNSFTEPAGPTDMEVSA